MTDKTPGYQSSFQMGKLRQRATQAIQHSLTSIMERCCSLTGPKPQTYPQPAAETVPQGLCGHSLVQGLHHEGMQVLKHGDCMPHQVLGWVVLWKDRAGRKDLRELESASMW